MLHYRLYENPFNDDDTDAAHPGGPGSRHLPAGGAEYTPERQSVAIEYVYASVDGTVV